MRGPLPVLAVLLALVAPFAVPFSARADDDAAQLFADGAKALHEGRAGDAITEFEALADRGVVDAVASYDRGLAYATRVRIGAEAPGDLGRAIHGFEEARDLTRDTKLRDDASTALTVVRSEVARRRTQAGESVEVDPGRSLGRTLAGLLSEDTWSVLAACASGVLALGLFLRWLSAQRRVRIGGGVAAGLAAPVLAVSLAMLLAARHDRLTLVEAVVVAPGARPVDARGITAAGASPLPEGARVEVVESEGGRRRVRFGATDVWIPAGTLRELARAW
jgi:hypothetical protein